MSVKTSNLNMKYSPSSAQGGRDWNNTLWLTDCTEAQGGIAQLTVEIIGKTGR